VLVLVGLLQPLAPIFYLSIGSDPHWNCIDYYVMARTFRPLGKYHIQTTPCLISLYEGRSYILGGVVLVLVGLLQPLAPIFEYWITKSSLELYRLLCNGQNFPLIGKVSYTNHTMLEKSV
jgi:hypothetical protein